jgi:hypothetical protein
MTMELDLEGRHADRGYAMLASLVTPRPIAWVTTVDLEGVVNAALQLLQLARGVAAGRRRLSRRP